MTWLRARFRADYNDWRPISWPPPGPCWCTGWTANDGYSIVVAYVETEDQIKEFWPEASHIDIQPQDKIIFSGRFEKPDWWTDAD